MPSSPEGLRRFPRCPVHRVGEPLHHHIPLVTAFPDKIEIHTAKPGREWLLLREGRAMREKNKATSDPLRAVCLEAGLSPQGVPSLPPLSVLGLTGQRQKGHLGSSPAQDTFCPCSCL